MLQKVHRIFQLKSIHRTSVEVLSTCEQVSCSSINPLWNSKHSTSSLDEQKAARPRYMPFRRLLLCTQKRPEHSRWTRSSVSPERTQRRIRHVLSKASYPMWPYGIVRPHVLVDEHSLVCQLVVALRHVHEEYTSLSAMIWPSIAPEVGVRGIMVVDSLYRTTSSQEGCNQSIEGTGVTAHDNLDLHIHHFRQHTHERPPRGSH